MWPEHPPRDPRAWLTTVATRRLVDARRSEAARYAPRGGDVRRAAAGRRPRTGDDTLFLLFCCCHPDLSPASQVALTLRAVGGLTTREIADAFYVPEATMAQRISRAKRDRCAAAGSDQPGDLAVVLRVLYLIYTAGHCGPGRPGRRGDPARPPADPGHRRARGARAARADAAQPRPPPGADSTPTGRIVTLDRQDRGLWDTRRDRRGRARPAGGAGRAAPRPLPDRGRHRRPARRRGERRGDRLAADPRLVRRPGRASATSPCARTRPRCSGRAVAVGHVLGAAAGLRETDRLREVLGDRHQWHAVRGYLHELGGDLPRPPRAYAEAARLATNVAERDHLVRQAARARALGSSA